MKIFKDLSKMTASIPSMKIENGISVMVEILNSKGLITEMSCEGHGKSKAWVSICPAHFKGYMDSHSDNMKTFLMTGDRRWSLEIGVFGMTKFNGIGQMRPKKINLKRVIELEMEVKIVLNHKNDIKRMERAARKYL